MKHDSPTCSWTHDHIDAYLDGDLDERNATALERHVHSCERCGEELALARRLVSELRGMPNLRCPDEVSDRVLAYAERNGRRADGWWSRVRALAANRAFAPAVVAAFVVVVIVSALVVDNTRRPRYTPEEIALAEAQLKWTFTYMNEVGRQTGAVVREDVLEASFVKPVRQAVDALDHAEDNIDNGGHEQ